jgi:hypothetical protein
VRLRPSSKPYKHTLLAKTLSIRASHRISTGFPHRDGGVSGAKAPSGLALDAALKGRSSTQTRTSGKLRTRNGMAFRLDDDAGEYTAFRARANGRQKIEKRTGFWRSLL